MLCLFVLLLQDGSTALHIAAYNNHLEIIKVLVTYGVDINVVNKVYLIDHCMIGSSS